MIEPLPKVFSIWETAWVRARLFSLSSITILGEAPAEDEEPVTGACVRGPMAAAGVVCTIGLGAAAGAGAGCMTGRTPFVGVLAGADLLAEGRGVGAGAGPLAMRGLASVLDSTTGDSERAMGPILSCRGWLTCG